MLLLDRFNSHITAELLPFSDDFQTTPYSLINPILLPIFRLLPDYSQFSDNSQTTPFSQITSIIKLLQLLHYQIAPITQIFGFLPNYSKHSEIYQL